MMNKKKACMILFLVLTILLFTLSVSAFQIKTLTIEVEINENGFASIVEKYSLDFDTTTEVDEFREKARINSSSLLAWQADYNFIFPHFGPIADKIVERSIVTYEEETQTLILSYNLANSFAQVKLDEPRQTIWSIPSRNLAAFESEGLITIPENTTIEFNLPLNAQIILLEPSASLDVLNNTVFLSAISTSVFTIEYSIQKPLSSTINIVERLNEFAQSQPAIIVAIILLLVLTIGFFNRKKIEDKIEDYIVNHSKFEASEPEEEMDLEG